MQEAWMQCKITPTGFRERKCSFRNYRKKLRRVLVDEAFLRIKRGQNACKVKVVQTKDDWAFVQLPVPVTRGPTSEVVPMELLTLIEEVPDQKEEPAKVDRRTKYQKRKDS